MALGEVIKVADPETLTFEGVDETLQELGYRPGFDQEFALRYGRVALPFLTEKLNDKAVNASIYPQMVFSDRSIQTPIVRWGVVGSGRAAGTLAAMRAMQHQAEEAELASEVTYHSEGKEGDLDRFASITRVWFKFALTDPELRPVG